VEWLGWPRRLDQARGSRSRVYGKSAREEWTLKSVGPILGAKQPPRPWDVVNVVVDPQVVEVSVAAPYLMRHT
jgi:hypothetical protein